MPELVRVEDGRGSVLFETELPRVTIEEMGVSDRLMDAVAAVTASADQVGTAIRVVVDSVRASFEGMATDKAHGGVLSGLEVEFGLNVSGEGSLYVAKAGAEANLSIKVTWDFGS
jgi:inner membrane protein involved in colicin E2 resistance